jgi:hypothetical protein
MQFFDEVEQSSLRAVPFLAEITLSKTSKFLSAGRALESGEGFATAEQR